MPLSDVNCPACGDCFHEELGQLGDRTHYRCRACGMVFSNETTMEEVRRHNNQVCRELLRNDGRNA
jgi:uncharacterized Zn finger protein